MVIHFTNARLVDATRDEPGELLVVDRDIAWVGAAHRAPEVPSHARSVDCGGKVLSPALIDAGVFAADARACLAGGIASVVLMPDGSPPLDEPSLIVFARAHVKPHIWVHPLAAATSPKSKQARRYGTSHGAARSASALSTSGSTSRRARRFDASCDYDLTAE